MFTELAGLEPPDAHVPHLSQLAQKMGPSAFQFLASKASLASKDQMQALQIMILIKRQCVQRSELLILVPSILAAMGSAATEVRVKAFQALQQIVEVPIWHPFNH